MTVAYYRDFDDRVYACVGPMASEALFRLTPPLIGTPHWEFLVPDSPVWDSAHQEIFRNGRAERIWPEKFPIALPPLPPIPPGPFPKWKDHFLPASPIRVGQFPSIAALFAAGRPGGVTAFVVLFEDPYETSLGDGEFHYFRDAFLTREDAERYVQQTQSDTERFHLRSMTIALDGNTFAFPDFDPKLFDRYSVEEVLLVLEARLGRPEH